MTMLLDETRTLTPRDSRTHIRYRFEIARPARKLSIDFSYSPKLLEDQERSRELMEACIDKYVEPDKRETARSYLDRGLGLSNLLTLSVDDPFGYRGACHRHDREQRLFLSADDASHGLTKGFIAPGQWTITVSIHSVVTESCDFRLTVRPEPEEPA